MSKLLLLTMLVLGSLQAETVRIPSGSSIFNFSDIGTYYVNVTITGTDYISLTNQDPYSDYRSFSVNDVYKVRVNSDVFVYTLAKTVELRGGETYQETFYWQWDEQILSNGQIALATSALDKMTFGSGDGKGTNIIKSYIDVHVLSAEPSSLSDMLVIVAMLIGAVLGSSIGHLRNWWFRNRS